MNPASNMRLGDLWQNRHDKADFGIVFRVYWSQAQGANLADLYWFKTHETNTNFVFGFNEYSNYVLLTRLE